MKISPTIKKFVAGLMPMLLVMFLGFGLLTPDAFAKFGSNSSGSFGRSSFSSSRSFSSPSKSYGFSSTPKSYSFGGGSGSGFGRSAFSGSSSSGSGLGSLRSSGSMAKQTAPSGNTWSMFGSSTMKRADRPAPTPTTASTPSSGYDYSRPRYEAPRYRNYGTHSTTVIVHQPSTVVYQQPHSDPFFWLWLADRNHNTTVNNYGSNPGYATPAPADGTIAQQQPGNPAGFIIGLLVVLAVVGFIAFAVSRRND